MSDEGKTETSAGDGGKAARSKRIGLVATDPIRILGWEQMFASPQEETARVQIVPLSVPGVMQDATLGMVLVDASCTEHLFELITTFRRMRPHVRLIVIGDSADPEYIQQVIGAGARGYLTQTSTESEIRMALDVVSDGSVWAPRKVLARLLDASGSFAPGAKQIAFTARETEILMLLVSGLGNREIANALQIDESTVKAHVARLMRKAGAKNRVELSVAALNQLAQ